MLKYVAPLEQRLRHLYVPKREKPTGVSTGESETTGQRLAEHTAAALGSWKFIGIQSALMLFWIAWNAAAPFAHWDNYPYIALNLAMSAEAALTGPILLIAANVGAIRDHRQFDRMERLERRAEDMEENVMTKLTNMDKKLDDALNFVRDPEPAAPKPVITKPQRKRVAAS